MNPEPLVVNLRLRVCRSMIYIYIPPLALRSEMHLAYSFDAPTSELTEPLRNEEMNSFSLVQLTSGNLAAIVEGSWALSLKSQIINFETDRYIAHLYGVFCS
ncbi:hypothetical protein RF11_02349 [Thelohanellus kitauei]|uniref:Uncharacterized protein n=1 Tax=Thelohanellus kitauei TaxID=669202 RepID=A0A0C2NH70_THEKT|nr:hypothetical protein RF11_02349 [Thelohanellus kitauei]